MIINLKFIEMKTLILTLICSLLMTAFVVAQNDYNGRETQSLLGGDSKITGWFVGIDNSFSQLNDKCAALPGFSFGMVINRSIQFGLIGKSFSWHETYLKYDNVMPEACYLNGGYGGLYIDANAHAGRLIHLSFPLIIGGGGASYLSANKYPEPDDNGEIDYSRKELALSPFFVLEPGVNLEMNITGFMKVYSGVSYRWINGMRLENTSNHAFDGFNLNVGLRFGKF